MEMTYHMCWIFVDVGVGGDGGGILLFLFSSRQWFLSHEHCNHIRTPT